MVQNDPQSAYPSNVSTVLYADRVSGICGACGMNLNHPLTSYVFCPNCEAKFVMIAPTEISLGVEPPEYIAGLRPDLLYVGTFQLHRPS